MPPIIPAAAALLVAASSASAHHGFTGRYDVSAPLWVEGEVVRAYFGRPHAEIAIRTAPDLSPPVQTPEIGAGRDVIDPGALAVRDDTRGREVEVELPPLRMFFDLGRRVAVGDRIAVIAFRNCEAPHQLRGQWVRPADGPPVVRGGTVQYQVRGC